LVHESASVMGPLVLTSANVSNVSIRAYLTIMEGRYGAVRGMVQVPDPYNTRTRVRIWPYRTVHRAFDSCGGRARRNAMRGTIRPLLRTCVRILYGSAGTCTAHDAYLESPPEWSKMLGWTRLRYLPTSARSQAYHAGRFLNQYF
jgi:hypothetical protein